MLNKLFQHFRVNKPGIHVSRFVIDARITIAARGVETQRRHAVGFGRINRLAFDFQIGELALFGDKAHIGELWIGAGVRFHLRYGGEIINHLFAAHIGIHHNVAERLYLEHAFIGNISRLNRVANTAAAHHAKIGAGARDLRSQNHPSHIGLDKSDLTAIAFKKAIHATNFHLQLRFTFILERR